MANFGFEDLRIVNPYEVAFREAVSAVGGAHVLKSARVFETVAEAIADCSLVVGTTAAQKRELQQPIERIETGGAGNPGTCGTGWAPVRIGEIRPLERRFELLPFLAANSDSARHAVDEFGAGGGRLPV
jgi:hypothetical protein